MPLGRVSGTFKLAEKMIAADRLKADIGTAARARRARWVYRGSWTVSRCTGSASTSTMLCWF